MSIYLNNLKGIFIGSKFNYDYMDEANEFCRKVYENEDNIIKEKKLICKMNPLSRTK